MAHSSTAASAGLKTSDVSYPGKVETYQVTESAGSSDGGDVVQSSSGKIYRYPSNIVPSKSVPGSSGKGSFVRAGSSASGSQAGSSGSVGAHPVNIVPSKSVPGGGGAHSTSGKVTKRKISGSSLSSSPKSHRRAGSQVCKVIPVSELFGFLDIF